MGYTFRGHCTCQVVKLNLTLPQTLEQYSPRSCDCDFCTSRKISYLSDPKGLVEIQSDLDLTISKQGSQQAEFLHCPRCQQVIAASYVTNEKRIGALNALTLNQYNQMQSAKVASPKELDDKQKVSRWTQLWMPITVTGKCDQ